MILRVLFILFLAFLCQSCSSGNKRLESLSLINTLGYISKGEGSPSVVFEANLGDGHEVWGAVVQKISKITKVFAYTRNFDQQSSSPSGSFANALTSYEIAINLRKKLQANSVKPPYMLVGHSYAGLYVLKFAELYRQDVAGIVLVDGWPAGFSNSCQQLNLGNCTTPYLIQSLRAPKEQQEIRGLPERENIAPSAEKLGSLPITVMTATLPEKNQTQSYQEHWVRAQEKFARLLKNGKLVTAIGSRHNIHRSRPDLVIQEIKELIDKVK